MSSIWQIPVERISSAGYTIDEQVSKEWLTELLKEPNTEFPWQALKEAHIEIRLVPEAKMIHVTGNAHVVAACHCVRCMKETVFQVPLQLNVRLAPSSEQEEELEMEWMSGGNSSLNEDDEVAISHYDNGVIDVTALIREQLFLDLPLYPVCERDCDFRSGTVDNRWSPFAALRERMSKP